MLMRERHARELEEGEHLQAVAVVVGDAEQFGIGVEGEHAGQRVRQATPRTRSRSASSDRAAPPPRRWCGRDRAPGPNADGIQRVHVATSEARVSSTLTLTRSRKVAPASSSTRLMLATTKPNCASKPSASAPLVVEAGNAGDEQQVAGARGERQRRRFDARRRREVLDRGHRDSFSPWWRCKDERAMAETTLPIRPIGYNPQIATQIRVARHSLHPNSGKPIHEDVIRPSCRAARADRFRRHHAVLRLARRRGLRAAHDLQGGLDHRRLRRQRHADLPRPDATRCRPAASTTAWCSAARRRCCAAGSATSTVPPTSPASTARPAPASRSAAAPAPSC